MRKEVKKQKVLRFMADFETLTGRDVVDETYVWARAFVVLTILIMKNI